MKKKTSKSIIALLIIVMCMMSCSYAFADTEEPTSAVIIREDISSNEAALDSSYNKAFDTFDSYNNALETRDSKWVCWGTRGLNTNLHMYYPIGYSELRMNGNIVNNYHYTRTFLGSKNNPKGDSGRCWGWKTVKAVGKPVDNELWGIYVHRVYYGVSGD